jgi:hypothetical protein
MSDNASIWVIHLLEEVSPSPTEIGNPRRGVDGLRGVARSRDGKVSKSMCGDVVGVWLAGMGRTGE